MGLEAVKEEVIRNAKNQEQSLIAEARSESGKIAKGTEKKIEQLKEESSIETKKMVDVMKKQELASAELENKKMLLEAKKEIIEKVFIEVLKRLDDLDFKKRETYMNNLLEKAKNDIEVANIYCNKKDIKLLKDFKAEAIGIVGGLIAENKDKTIRVDYSFNTMLQSIKENELQSINKILFS